MARGAYFLVLATGLLTHVAGKPLGASPSLAVEEDQRFLANSALPVRGDSQRARPTAVLLSGLGEKEDEKWKECDKSWLIALLLTIFLFTFGAGRFYLGHPIMGCIQLGVNVLFCCFQCTSMYRTRYSTDKDDSSAVWKALGYAVLMARCLYPLWWIAEIALLCMGITTPKC